MIDIAPLETRQLPSKNAFRLSDEPHDGKEGMELAQRQLQPPALSLCAVSVVSGAASTLFCMRQKAEVLDRVLQPLWPLALLRATGTQHLTE